MSVENDIGEFRKRHEVSDVIAGRVALVEFLIQTGIKSFEVDHGRIDAEFCSIHRCNGRHAMIGG